MLCIVSLQSLREDDLRGVQGWKDIIPEMEGLWIESKNVCKQKNKKREFQVTFKEPEKTGNGFKLWIEVIWTIKLNITYLCLVFLAENYSHYTVV